MIQYCHSYYMYKLSVVFFFFQRSTWQKADEKSQYNSMLILEVTLHIKTVRFSKSCQSYLLKYGIAIIGLSIYVPDIELNVIIVCKNKQWYLNPFIVFPFMYVI